MPYSAFNYRPDIDGLRAVAVLLVVGFHAFPELVPSGFIGVDVFFVVSGFLISTIIYKALERGEFSYFHFYDRRIRRIFPALVIVLPTCLFLGAFLLLPEEYRLLGRHVTARGNHVERNLRAHQTRQALRARPARQQADQLAATLRQQQAGAGQTPDVGMSDLGVPGMTDMVGQLQQMFPGAVINVEGADVSDDGPVLPPVRVVASQSEADPVARLEKLARLRDAGVIDQAQFDQLKAKILGDAGIDP